MISKCILYSIYLIVWITCYLCDSLRHGATVLSNKFQVIWENCSSFNLVALFKVNLLETVVQFNLVLNEFCFKLNGKLAEIKFLVVYVVHVLVKQ